MRLNSSPHITLVVNALMLGGCAAAPALPIAAAAGAGTGAAAGAAVGSGTGQIAAAATGGALGALAGMKAAEKLDRSEKERAAEAERRAAAEGRPVAWSSSTVRGMAIAGPPFNDEAGRPCREIGQQIEIDGKKEQGFAIYCRGSDGFWRLSSAL